MPDIPSPAVPDRGDDDIFHERVMRYLDDALDADGVAALERSLAEDPARRQAFASICWCEALVQEQWAGMPVAMTAEEGREERRPWKPWRIVSRIAPRKRRLAAAALVLVAATLYLVVRVLFPGPAAYLVAVSAPRWEGIEVPPDLTPGAGLYAGRALTLVEGVAKFRFGDGTIVVAVGPTRLRINSPRALHLDTGKITARMPASATRFTVSTALATVTDLGTEFGVVAEAATTAVHVFEGRVRVERGGAAAATSREAIAGDLAVVTPGGLELRPGAIDARRFVRDYVFPAATVDVADLLSGGGGSSHRRGGVIDPSDGTVGYVGRLAPAARLASDGRYHPTRSRTGLDGTFMPNGVAQVAPDGRTFAFPKTVGTGSFRIAVGGDLPMSTPNEGSVPSQLDGVDYSLGRHGYILMHSNVGITFDLAAIRRLHPGLALSRFRCDLGNSNPNAPSNRSLADAFFLVDGRVRFERRQFRARQRTSAVDVALAPSDRYLTVAVTDGGDEIWFDAVLLGDAVFEFDARRE